MQYLSLQSNNANQLVEFALDNNYYSIHLYTFKGFTLADITANGQVIVYGVRCVPNQNLIPQAYQTLGGNFRFLCVDETYPYFEQFNRTQQLVYYTDAELEALG